MSQPKKDSKVSSKLPSARTDLAVPNTMSASIKDEASFQNLRQKIEGNLQKAESKAHKKSADKRKNGSKNSDEQETSARGKKRTRNGDVKQGEPRPQDSNKPKQASAASNEDTMDLEAIVTELGGTKEDIELFDGVDSDSELEGLEAQAERHVQTEPKKGKTLESGMANILKEIALVRDTYRDCESEGEEGKKVNASANSLRPPADDKPSRKQDLADDDSIKFKSAATELKKDKGKKSALRCTPRPDWFNLDLPTLHDALEPGFAVSASSITQLHSYGKTLLHAENEAFKNSQVSSSSQSFYNTVIASGTLSDKISALTLAVQESPLHNTRALQTLIGLGQKRNRSQAVDVLRALKDLFAQGSMLPSDRRLHTFASQTGLRNALGQVRSWQDGDNLPAGIQQSHLIVWTFEDWLKEQYFEILKLLETWGNDEIEFAKTRATTYIYELLKEKPEQESNLLRLLINKLGDPVKKIASQASYLIMQLLASHPAMKEVIVSAIEVDFIFKPGQTTHARYYATVTLNQTALSMNEESVAVKLLNIYFGLFKIILKAGDDHKEAQLVKSTSRHQRQRKQAALLPNLDQEEQLREKLISAVLTGVNRAYPYAGSDHQSFNQHVDTLFQITHSANFNTSIQAMMLIHQLLSNTSSSKDRFYRVLYESLLDPRLVTSSKQQLYLNLLHRALKADLSQKRVKAFAKRILQILSLQDPSFICGAFFLLKDLEKTFPSLATMIDQPEDNEDDREVFRDVDTQSVPTNIPDSQGLPTDSDNGTKYDATKRDPIHANADTSSLWDITPYLAHYHPAVTVGADHFLDHQPLPGKPDLTLHTLIHFLDRFVYKNAKLSAGTKMRGSSIMQPMASDDTKAVLVSVSAGGIPLSVNSAEFVAKKEGEVASEDVFFHQYFKNLGKSAVAKNAKRAKVADDEDDESDDEDEVWKAMVNNAPDLEGLEADDGDDFSDLEDFEEAMEDDDSDQVDLDEGIGSDMEMGMDDVDIEAGIFDDSDDEENSEVGSGVDNDSEADFEGLDSDAEEVKKTKPSKKTIMKKEDRERKKMLKALPTFASIEDYQKMLDDDDDDEENEDLH